MNGKHTKFNDEQILKLFELLNSDSQIKKISPAFGTQFWHQQLHPTSLSNFQNPNAVKNELKPGKKLNATITIDAGHVYDTWGKAKQKTMEERKKEAKKKAYAMVDRMNAIMQQSSDPLYSQLVAEIINKELEVFRTYNDHSDDGDDHYGMQLFFSIHYKH